MPSRPLWRHCNATGLKELCCHTATLGQFPTRFCLIMACLLGMRVRSSLNTLRPKQYGLYFPDDIFKWIFLNENVCISIKISLKFNPKGLINNNPALVQIMAWCRLGDKPLSEPMMFSLLTHICVTGIQLLPAWVDAYIYVSTDCYFNYVPADQIRLCNSLGTSIHHNSWV